jgi:DNA-directed RNA polymerase subunit M/transcription elongation factor TFIIS
MITSRQKNKVLSVKMRFCLNCKQTLKFSDFENNESSVCLSCLAEKKDDFNADEKKDVTEELKKERRQKKKMEAKKKRTEFAQQEKEERKSLQIEVRFDISLVFG